jgi:tRNA threonylcarbamoyladenosine biosynthesis protein TsaB
MSLILNIDTSTEIAMVCLSENGNVISEMVNTNQKDHASFLHVAILELLKKQGIELKSLSAIAVTEGPGSYTGLRVGLSTAKGLCYSLDKPLILISSLEVIANDARNNYNESKYLFCPMIDARRMEVFTGLYDHDLRILVNPSATILEKDFLSNYLQENRIVFSGNGSMKFQTILDNKNAIFFETNNLSSSISQLSQVKFNSSIFSNLAHSGPQYLKEFVNFI